MKKFFSSFILLAFLIASQMHLVHAVDMISSTMEHSHHGITKIEEPTFCEASTNDNNSECVKEILPYKLIIPENRKEVIEKITFLSLRISLIGEIPGKNIEEYHNTKRLGERIFQKTEYRNLVGILKKLD